MVTIKVKGVEATLAGEAWSSESTSLVRVLEVLSNPWPGPEEGSPELTIVDRVRAAFPGGVELVAFVDEDPPAAIWGQPVH